MAKVRRVQHVSVGILKGSEADARHFYSTALGLTEKPRPLGLKANPVIWFDAGDEHEVHLLSTEGYVAPAGNHLCLEVDDLAAMRAHLTQHHIPITDVAPIDTRPRFMITDPSGNTIELTQIHGPYTPVD